MNALGQFFCHEKRKATTGDDLPLIDLGPKYCGPIPRAYGHTETYTDDSGEYRTRTFRERFANEVIAYEFLGRPPRDIYGCGVVHLDGDTRNLAADNLAWQVDEEFFEVKSFNYTRQLMRPDHLPPRRAPIITKSLRNLLFVNSDNPTDWTPKASLPTTDNERQAG